MKRICPVILLAAAPFLGLASGMAQSAADTPAATDAAPIAPQKPALPPIPDAPPAANPGAQESAPAPATPARPPASKETSTSLMAAISAGLPQYDPPKPTPPPTPVESQDLREIDKPANGIVRLPKYLVQEPKAAILNPADLMTPAAQAALEMKEHPGLSWVPFGWMNGNIAQQMYQEDKRLNNISDLTDTANSIKAGGDSGESEYIKRETNDTYMRGIDWGGTIPKP